MTFTTPIPFLWERRQTQNTPITKFHLSNQLVLFLQQQMTSSFTQIDRLQIFKRIFSQDSTLSSEIERTLLDLRARDNWSPLSKQLVFLLQQETTSSLSQTDRLETFERIFSQQDSDLSSEIEHALHYLKALDIRIPSPAN